MEGFLKEFKATLQEKDLITQLLNLKQIGIIARPGNPCLHVVSRVKHGMRHDTNY